MIRPASCPETTRRTLVSPVSVSTSSSTTAAEKQYPMKGSPWPVARSNVDSGGTAQPWAARPTWFLTQAKTASRQARPLSATIGSMAERIFAAASRIALPLITVPRLAEVGPLSGIREVSHSTMRTSSTGHPSDSAAIWARAVDVPWPASAVPTATLTLPSGDTTMLAPAGLLCLPRLPRPIPK